MVYTFEGPSMSRFVFGLIALVLCPQWLAAQENLCTRVSSTADVQFKLSVAGEKTVFQLGEIVPLDLSFTANKEGAYWAESRPEGRNTRLFYELYCVKPAAPDPLETYFNGNGGAVDGPAYDNPLGTKPFVAHVELNEFLTLMPGKYEIYAVSSRVFYDPTCKGWFCVSQTWAVVQSNAIGIEIRPAPREWEMAQIDEAQRILASSSHPEEAYHAARTLRFLNSEDAARALVRNYSGKEDYDQAGARELKLGLFGSPFRQLILSEMHDLVTAPERAVTEGFLDTLSRLQITADPAWATLTGSETADARRQFIRRYTDHETALLNAEARRLVAALPNKIGVARATSAEAVLKCCADDAELADPAKRALVASWKYLPEVDQMRLVTADWQVLNSPGMVPILEQMLLSPVPRPGGLSNTAHHDALKHLYELAPLDARPFIDQDLRASRTRPPVELLELLTGAELAAAVQPSIDRIASDQGDQSDYERLDRFAGREELPQIDAAFERSLKARDCKGQGSMIHYFIRVDPIHAADKADEILDEEATSNCVPNLFLNLEESLSVVEGSAIRALNHPNFWVVQDAAGALGRYGTGDAESALWARLEQQHRMLQKRVAPPELKPGKVDDEIMISQDLIEAIGTGTAWLSPPEKLARLRELTDTEGERKSIDDSIRIWKDEPPTIEPIWWDEDFVQFNFLPLSNLTEAQLKTRIALYPKGTKIMWEIWNPGFPRQSVLRAELEKFQSWMKPLGIELVPETLP
jgi:hypothetical protein